MDGLIQRVVVNGSMSRWRSVTSGVPQGSVLRPILLNIFINDIDSGIECTLSKVADDAKLSGAADTPEGWDAIQRDLDTLEKSAHVNLMRFNKAKCKVLHLGRGNPRYQYRLQDEGIETSPAEKGLGPALRRRAWGYWWMKSQQCALTAQKANRTPRLYQTKHGQQVEGGDSAPLLRSGESPPAVLRPAPGSSLQDRHGPAGVGPEEGHKNDQRDGTPLL